jgi:hypothetical protein
VDGFKFVKDFVRFFFAGKGKKGEKTVRNDKRKENRSKLSEK